MKRQIVRLAALLLALLLLSGCGGQRVTYADLWPAAARTEQDPVSEESAGAEEPEAEEVSAERPKAELTVFSQLPYERPDLDGLRRSVQAATASLSGDDLQKTEALLDDCQRQYEHYDTMYVIADIRNCRDLTDEYYAEEYRWCDENYAEMQQLFDDLYYACAASGFGRQLEEDCFWEGFLEDYADESDSLYSDETVALMQEERSLVAQYRALSADPVIEWNGGQVSYYDLLDQVSDWDYARAVMAYYQQYNERYAELFIRLVDVRSRLAAQMGYDSYEQMQYEYTYDRDYSPEEAVGYLEGIRRVVVPYYQELMEGDPYADVWYDTVDEQTLYGVLEAAVEELGSPAAEAFAFMTEHELYDISLSARKAAMSFQTYLSEYAAPYLFLCPAGDTEDILSMAHEFGHFTDAYANENAYETIDLAEVYSQAMEYLILSRLGSSLEREDVDNIARLKMLDTVELYIQQASFAEFEHRLYAMDPGELSAETINALSLELAREYGYYTPRYETFYSMEWVEITHFFEMPFYVVSYPMSNDLAIQLFALEQAEPGSGLEKYRQLLDRDFSGLMEAVEAGSLESPFAPGRLESVVELMRRTFAGEASVSKNERKVKYFKINF